MAHQAKWHMCTAGGEVYLASVSVDSYWVAPSSEPAGTGPGHAVVDSVSNMLELKGTRMAPAAVSLSAASAIASVICTAPNAHVCVVLPKLQLCLAQSIMPLMLSLLSWQAFVH